SSAHAVEAEIADSVQGARRHRVVAGRRSIIASLWIRASLVLLDTGMTIIIDLTTFLARACPRSARRRWRGRFVNSANLPFDIVLINTIPLTNIGTVSLRGSINLRALV